MHRVKFIFNDYRSIDVDVEDGDVKEFFSSIQNHQPYFNQEKGIGFWLPPENLRCAFITKELTKKSEEPCQKIVSLEADPASKS